MKKIKFDWVSKTFLDGWVGYAFLDKVLRIKKMLTPFLSDTQGELLVYLIHLIYLLSNSLASYSAQLCNLNPN